MSIFLAFLSSVSFGAADFLGGLATRRSGRVFSVVVLSQAVGLSIVLAALMVGRPELIAGDIGWAAAAGVAGSAGLVLLYRGLSIGTMSVVAPLSAVMGALVPVGWGLITGERPTALAIVGVPVALAAIGLVSGAASNRGLKGPGMLEGVGAGVGFGFFFILIARSGSAELWTLTFARIASISVLILLATVTGSTLRPGPGMGPLIAAAGVLDMVANLLFLMAERRGLLTLVAVIAALYPAATVVLARIVLHERLSRSQLIGLGMAAAGIALIAVG